MADTTILSSKMDRRTKAKITNSRKRNAKMMEKPTARPQQENRPPEDASMTEEDFMDAMMFMAMADAFMDADDFTPPPQRFREKSGKQEGEIKPLSNLYAEYVKTKGWGVGGKLSEEKFGSIIAALPNPATIQMIKKAVRDAEKKTTST